jgi:hypothetical protein
MTVAVVKCAVMTVGLNPQGNRPSAVVVIPPRRIWTGNIAIAAVTL